jgi:ketosteroid isomerase-like protein
VAEENVEVLHRWREAWGRQDVDGTVACLHDNVEIDFSAARGPFRGVYRGTTEVIGVLTSIWEAWGEASIEFAEVIDCGPDRVITVNVFRAQGRSSGATTGARVANLWSFRDGLVHRAKLFQSKAEALEAAGLSKEGDAGRGF